MLGIKVQPPGGTGEAADASGLAPGNKALQALLIAAISASSLSLLFSIGTAALSGAADPAGQQTQHESAAVRGDAGAESARVGRADQGLDARTRGVL